MHSKLEDIYAIACITIVHQQSIIDRYRNKNTMTPAHWKNNINLKLILAT